MTTIISSLRKKKQPLWAALLLPLSAAVSLSMPMVVAAQSASGKLSTSLSEPLKPVVLATLNWEPYIGTRLPGRGYVYHLVEEVFREMGYELRTEFYPWARALRTASGADGVSGLFPEYYSKSREREFVFSDPFPGGPIGFYKRVSDVMPYSVDPRKQPQQALRALGKKRIGVVRGYLNTESFDSADFLAKEEAISDEINLRKLYFGRLDLIIIDRYVAEHIIGTRFPHYRRRLEFVEPELEYKPLYIAFSRKDPKHQEYLKAFNEGIARLRARGDLKRIPANFGFSAPNNLLQDSAVDNEPTAVAPVE